MYTRIHKVNILKNICLLIGKYLTSEKENKMKTGISSSKNCLERQGELNKGSFRELPHKQPRLNNTLHTPRA